MRNDPSWKRWFRQQPTQDVHRLCEIAIERLMEIGEVAFQVDDTVDRFGDPVPEDAVDFIEMLYWRSSGKDLLKS